MTPERFADLRRWSDAHIATDEEAVVMADLLDHLDTLTAERDELAATLANERGKGPPPSEGWEWNPHARFWHRPGATAHWSDMGRMWWWSDSPDIQRHYDARRHYDERGPHTTARGAMRAADAAVPGEPLLAAYNDKPRGTT